VCLDPGKFKLLGGLRPKVPRGIGRELGGGPADRFPCPAELKKGFLVAQGYRKKKFSRSMLRMGVALALSQVAAPIFFWGALRWGPINPQRNDLSVPLPPVKGQGGKKNKKGLPKNSPGGLGRIETVRDRPEKKKKRGTLAVQIKLSFGFNKTNLSPKTCFGVTRKNYFGPRAPTGRELNLFFFGDQEKSLVPVWNQTGAGVSREEKARKHATVIPRGSKLRSAPNGIPVSALPEPWSVTGHDVESSRLTTSASVLLAGNFPSVPHTFRRSDASWS